MAALKYGPPNFKSKLMSNVKFIGTIEVTIIVDSNNCDDYEDIRRTAILKAQEIKNMVPNSNLIGVEVVNGLLTTEILNNQ